ncbi:MAG: hypothetical protein CVT93_07770 [Bacteroidetes bacterium HGW-Bacteroidetes-10]|jgi:hypothetical protein|nr:MAG: hypothetical protein CVT93_07770 [Bacteroidetes bacterium HGW-Bacteroidetes-10]
METKRLVGIISTILLIANYISTAVISSLFDVSDQFTETHRLIAVIVSFVGIIGFYYAVSGYLKQHNYKVENILIISVIFIKTVAIVLWIIQNKYNTIPYLYSSVLNAIVLILIAAFGVMIILRKDKDFINLRELKRYIISWFSAIFLAMLISGLLTYLQKPELMSITSLVLSIPNFFGLMFFLKDKACRN